MKLHFFYLIKVFQSCVQNNLDQLKQKNCKWVTKLIDQGQAGSLVDNNNYNKDNDNKQFSAHIAWLNEIWQAKFNPVQELW